MKNPLILFLLVFVGLAGCKDDPAKAVSTTQQHSTKATAPVEAPVEAPADPVNVCDRTEQVKNKILAKLEKTDCSAVTAEDLKSFVVLSLYNSNIVSLKAGDFAGLVTLKTLYITHNQLTVLPEGLFEGLSKLKTLYLSSNHLSSVPEGIFGPLVSLQRLSLDNNQLTILPEGVFAGLKYVEKVDLGHNRLPFLPEGIFGPLVSLKKLSLVDNALSEQEKQRITREVVTTVTL